MENTSGNFYGKDKFSDLGVNVVISQKITSIACLAMLIFMSIQLPAIAQDNFLNEGSDGSTLSTDTEDIGSLKTVKVNPFFKFSSPLLRVIFFLILMAIFFGFAMLIFQRALERDEDPTSAFFTGNVIFCLGLLVSGFLCFSDLAYPKNPAGLIDHFSKVSWYVYLILIVSFIILILLGRSRPQIQATPTPDRGEASFQDDSNTNI